LLRTLVSLLVSFALAACATQPPAWKAPAGAPRIACPARKPYQAGTVCYAKPFYTVYFPAGQATLSPLARAMIERQAAWLKTYPDKKIRVEGHTGGRGDAEGNYVLGLRRAQAVKDYLIALGIDPDRVMTASFGSRKPAARGRGRKALAQNRRCVSVAVDSPAPPDKN
jgi:peptidoglycan-associated lipoprotein